MSSEETIFDTACQTFSGLKKYPKMYLRGDITYLAIETYIYGYLAGLGCCLNIDFARKIHIWFQEKVKERNPVIIFTAHVKFYYKDRSEEEHIDILLDLVEEFFQEEFRRCQGV